MSSSTSTTEITSAPIEPSGHAVATFLDDNEELTRRVEAAIASNPSLSSSSRNVNVRTDGDIVTLSGSVPSYATRDALEDSVRALRGVGKVYDDVQVSPLRDVDRTESDENIAFSLQRSLVDQPRVTIEVERGVVTLRGQPSVSRELVERIASRTPGVVSVVNELSEPPSPTSLVQ